MPSWTVLTAPLPESLEDPEAWALHGTARVTYAREMAAWGYPDLMYPAWYLIAELKDQPYSMHRLLVAVADGIAEPTADDVVGMAKIVMPLADNTHLANVEVCVDPAHTGVGVGTELLAALEKMAADNGRTTVVAWSEHVGEPGPDDAGALEPPTGSGRVRADGAEARFARRHSYVLEQAERYSLLELPVDPALLERLGAAAAEKAGPDYRVHVWRDRVPDEWADQVAVLEARMSIDAPSGALDLEQTAWDATRVRTWEQQVLDSGHGYLMAAAEHVPTRTLAAFTILRFPVAFEEISFQDDTLVLPEFRGHNLGMLVKAANLQALGEARPGAKRVHTWNAEENQFMLAINVALGFRPTGVCGAWQKRLA